MRSAKMHAVVREPARPERPRERPRARTVDVVTELPEAAPEPDAAGRGSDQRRRIARSTAFK
mgnify:CR=1 FL=1